MVLHAGRRPLVRATLRVLLYSWYSYSEYTAAARWFVTMNYLVHSVMYTNYVFKTANLCALSFFNICQICQDWIDSTITRRNSLSHRISFGLWCYLLTKFIPLSRSNKLDHQVSLYLVAVLDYINGAASTDTNHNPCLLTYCPWWPPSGSLLRRKQDLNTQIPGYLNRGHRRRRLLPRPLPARSKTGQESPSKPAAAVEADIEAYKSSRPKYPWR